jgi:hypothetical protein
MSRHFVWLTALVNLALFLGLGVGLAALARFWPRIGAFYDERDDPRELTNRARSTPMAPVLARFRARLARIKK